MSETAIPDRNIHVGKSWPRPATPCDLVPNWEGEFHDHQDWVNFAHKRLTVAHDSNGAQLKAICVDTLGRRCANGRDMARARDEGTFPVRYFFECATPSPDGRLIAKDAEIAALREALKPFANKMTTQELHDNPEPAWPSMTREMLIEKLAQNSEQRDSEILAARAAIAAEKAPGA